MCGRVALYDEPDNVARLLDAGVDPELLDHWRPRFNIAPSRRVLGIAAHDGDRTLSPYTWGLVPSWSKDPTKVKGAFNARAETVATKPTFRSAFKRSRILVPVDAFYEWHTIGPDEKQPYAFTRADGEPIAMARLRESWRGTTGLSYEAQRSSRPRPDRICPFITAGP